MTNPKDSGEFPVYVLPTPEEAAAEAAAVLERAPFRPGVFEALAQTAIEPTSDLLYASQEDAPVPDRMMLRVPLPSGLSKEQLVEQAAEMGRHFERLTVDYGIVTAGYGGRVVLMSDVDGSPLAAVVGDKIAGEAYTHEPSEPVPEGQRPAAARLLRQLSAYYFDQLRRQAPILMDIFDLRQYRFVEDDLGNSIFILADNGSKLLNRTTLEPDTPRQELRAWGWSVMDGDEFAQWEVAMETGTALATAPAAEALRRLGLPGIPEDS